MENSNDNSVQVQDNTVGIVAYCTLIGFIVAIVLNGSKEGADKKFGAFHLRQALGLIICAVGGGIAIAILMTLLISISFSMVMIASMINLVFGLGILALVIIGIINAVNKTMKPLPVIGEMMNKMLGSTFE